MSNKLREAAELAMVQLDRLIDIIEGRHEQAHLVTPHGQSSAGPRQAADALRAALAARPDSPTLDVERLARALTVLRVRLEAAALAGKPVWQDDASFAETIAREYAALAARPDSPT